jgi:hypothetical protein
MDFMPLAFQKVYQQAVEKQSYWCSLSSNSSPPAVKTIVRGVDGKDQEIAALPPLESFQLCRTSNERRMDRNTAWSEFPSGLQQASLPGDGDDQNGTWSSSLGDKKGHAAD